MMTAPQYGRITGQSREPIGSRPAYRDTPPIFSYKYNNITAEKSQERHFYSLFCGKPVRTSVGRRRPCSQFAFGIFRRPIVLLFIVQIEYGKLSLL